MLHTFVGFLILFLLYQFAEANGQDLLKFRGKPYSIFLSLLLIPTADIVTRWQAAPSKDLITCGYLFREHNLNLKIVFMKIKTSKTGELNANIQND